MYAQIDSKRSFSQSDTKDDTRKALSPASSPISLHSKGESKEKNNELRESLIRDSAHRSPDSNMSRDTKSPRDGIEMNGVGRDSRGLRGVSNADDAHEDPFYVFKEDLLMKLELLDDTLLRYERVVQNTDTAVNTHEVKDSKKQVKRQIRQCESTLKDLDATIRLVDKKRNLSQFHHISDTELHDRKTFLSTCSNRIQQCKQKMSSEALKQKMFQDEKKKTKRRMIHELKGKGISDPKERDDLDMIENGHASAQMLLSQQDDTLDELDEAVERVGVMASTIHEEIGAQNKMLTDMEEDLNDAEEKLGLVLGKLGKLLKTKSKWQLGTILCLSMIVVVLFVLVIKT